MIPAALPVLQVLTNLKYYKQLESTLLNLLIWVHGFNLYSDHESWVSKGLIQIGIDKSNLVDPQTRICKSNSYK